MADRININTIGCFCFGNRHSAMLIEKESDRWGDPGGMMDRTCGHMKAVLIGEPANPGNDGRVRLA